MVRMRVVAATLWLNATLWLRRAVMVGGVSGGSVTTDQYQFSMPWQLTGHVEDTCVSVETVNEQHADMNRVLNKLVEQPFFRIFKVNLQRACKFFPDDGQCGQESCAVHEVPAPWLYESEQCVAVQPRRPEQRACQAMSRANDVDFTLLTRGFRGFNIFESEVADSLPPSAAGDASTLQSGRFGGPSWADLAAQEPMQYVNLQQNPERYTGYTGYTATRVWDAIYRENCFHDNGSAVLQCFEERVFYRLMSGLHASINTQLSRKFYPADQPNLLLWQHKVGLHQDRLENLYFTFVAVTRAVALSIPHLMDFNYAHDDPSTDTTAGRIMAQLASTGLISSGAPCFNESALFRTVPGEDPASATARKREFVNHFRNTSLILDCVVCEKCKLWGKLQVLGVGTALKILLSEAEGVPYDLERNEIVALFNTLTKLSSSIETIGFMSRLLEDPFKQDPGRIDPFRDAVGAAASDATQSFMAAVTTGTRGEVHVN